MQFLSWVLFLTHILWYYEASSVGWNTLPRNSPTDWMLLLFLLIRLSSLIFSCKFRYSRPYEQTCMQWLQYVWLWDFSNEGFVMKSRTLHTSRRNIRNVCYFIRTLILTLRAFATFIKLVTFGSWVFHLDIDPWPIFALLSISLSDKPSRLAISIIFS